MVKYSMEARSQRTTYRFDCASWSIKSMWSLRESLKAELVCNCGMELTIRSRAVAAVVTRRTSLRTSIKRVLSITRVCTHVQVYHEPYHNMSQTASYKCRREYIYHKWKKAYKRILAKKTAFVAVSSVRLFLPKGRLSMWN